MARKTYVNVTSEETKAAILDKSVLSKDVPINPVGSATDMKKRFVAPIVDAEGASAIGEIDRVAQETESAFLEVDADIGNLQEDTTRLFGAVTTQSATNEAQNQAIQDLQEGKLDKTGGDVTGEVVVKSQGSPSKTEISDQGVFVSNNSNGAGTAYADGRILSLGKQYTFPQKEGALVSAQEAVGSVYFGIDEDNNLNLRLYDAAGVFLANYSISLPVDNVVVSGYYDEATSTIALTLKSGNVVRVPVGALVSGLISSSEKGAPNGVASLDAEGKVPKEQLPEGGGSGGESVDLSEYVKFTDYASKNNFGVVKIGQGLKVDANNGLLYTEVANKTMIDLGTYYYQPIVPSMLRYAVKAGVTTNNETLTDEEKSSACEWLGAVKAPAKPSSFNYLLTFNQNGVAGTLKFSSGTDANAIVQRKSGGQIPMPYPTADDSGVPKSYVDELIAKLKADNNLV